MLVPRITRKNSVILSELEQATGISSRHLTDFQPGVGDVRSRLQWASMRRTTRPEDIAYSLLGVFNLHLPVLYGESAENALGRLFAQVIAKSGIRPSWTGSGKHHPFVVAFLPPLPRTELFLSLYQTPQYRDLYIAFASLSFSGLRAECTKHFPACPESNSSISGCSCHALFIVSNPSRSIKWVPVLLQPVSTAFRQLD